MKKIFCKFLSTTIMMTIVFGFFIPQDAFAVKVSEILREPTINFLPGTQCAQTLRFLNDYLEQKAVPNSAEGIDGLWSNQEFVAKTLSLILYKISFSEEHISPDTTFSSPCLKRPSVNLRNYVNRFLRYSLPRGEISHGAVILALIYLDELRSRNPNTIFIELMNVHRLFSSSYLISSKFYEDTFYDNEYMARVAGVPTEELSFMEIEFLAKIYFHLSFGVDCISHYENLFENLLRKVPNVEWDYDY